MLFLLQLQLSDKALANDIKLGQEKYLVYRDLTD